MIVSRFPVKKVDCDLREIVGDKINREDVDNKMNDRKKSKATTIF